MKPFLSESRSCGTRVLVRSSTASAASTAIIWSFFRSCTCRQRRFCSWHTALTVSSYSFLASDSASLSFASFCHRYSDRRAPNSCESSILPNSEYKSKSINKYTLNLACLPFWDLLNEQQRYPGNQVFSSTQKEQLRLRWQRCASCSSCLLWRTGPQ